MRPLLFVLWLATIGADRIDLLAGAGPVVLKPFLILSPIIIFIEGVEAIRGGRRVAVPQDARWFFVLQTALLCVLLVSVAWSLHIGLAFGRLALMITEGYLCFLVVLLLVNRPDAREVLVRGALVGMSLMLVMSGLQTASWIGVAVGPLELGGIVDLSSASYGPLIPRPSGSPLDPNRGGFVFLIYVFLLLLLAPRSRIRSIMVAAGSLGLLLTLSRSALLAAVVTFAGWLVWRGIRIPRAVLGVAGAAGALLVGLLMFSGESRDALLAVGEILAGRVSVREGSSSDHISLIARGWDVGTADLRNLFLGVGFGNSYLILQDFFAGTKYANFHSMYITLLVEAGILALMPVLALMLYPFYRGSAFRPIVLGLIFFNIFYQAHSEAMFWLVLALAWMMPRVGDVGRPAAVRASLAPEQVRQLAGADL